MEENGEARREEGRRGEEVELQGVEWKMKVKQIKKRRGKKQRKGKRNGIE